MIAFNARSTWTIYKREVMRAMRTAMQSILGPVLTTVLYFVVFGAAIGGRMDSGACPTAPSSCRACCC